MPLHLITRPATENDAKAIQDLMGVKDRVHRHLDWLSPLERLGEQPYFVIEKDFNVCAALACPEDPPGVAWIRFFATQPDISLNDSWQILFQAVQKNLGLQVNEIVSVAVQTWYLRMLLEEGFSLHQTIVVLHLNTPMMLPPLTELEFSISKMTLDDMEEVAFVDHAAFQPIWQNSHQELESAYEHASHATVARKNNIMLGYQISSAMGFNAHLARLAVLPGYQGLGIGAAITREMIAFFRSKGIGSITVNTQSDNTSSLKLYKKLGFKLTGERFPVLIFQE